MENISDTITGVIELDKKLVFLLDLEKAIAELNSKLAITNSLNDDTGDIIPDFRETIKVLHADDSNVIRHNVKLRLEEKNRFTVNSVINGERAWSYLLDIKETAHAQGCEIANLIDVVLTDIEMPGMDGYTLCKRIKDDQELRSVPVILFSSLITDKLVHKGQAVGADGQFAKPDLKLILFIKDLVEKRKKAA
jgi:two-component system chemotaxis response regulator CheV